MQIILQSLMSGEQKEDCEGSDTFHKIEGWIHIFALPHWNYCVTASSLQCRFITILPPSGPHSRRMPTKERQRLLQEQYYFLCQCEACSLQTEEEEGTEGKEQWSGLHESGLLCTNCKGSLKVGVHCFDCDLFIFFNN